jgi:hypothetical protein
VKARSHRTNGRVFLEIQANVVAEILRLQIFEQTVLLNAVTAYMNLLRDAAILELQRSNVNVLENRRIGGSRFSH